ncbi:hypothetical protein DTZ28_08940 [Escherichia coli]|nr:hypothetical protein [Escherichia coli]EGD5020093.1 hypothetical protein [Escherichia coli]EGD5151502.1 hypothetical protein [Escherichia coli]
MSDTTELVDLAVIFPDLEIELKYACADNITGKAIYQQARCLHAADDARGFLAQNTAGSGPFMLKSWQKGQQLVLVQIRITPAINRISNGYR